MVVKIDKNQTTTTTAMSARKSVRDV